MPVPKMFVGPHGVRAGWRVLVWLVVLTALAVAMGLGAQPITAALRAAFANLPPGVGKVIGESVSSAMVWGLVVVGTRLTWLAFRKDRDYSRYGLALSDSSLKAWVKGLGLGVVSLLLSALLMVVAGGVRIGYQTGPLTLAFGLLWFASQFFVAVFEEFLFRGYLFTTVADGLGKWWAVAVTAVVFSLAHMGNPGENPVGLFNVVVVGFVFGFCVLRTGSLWVAVGLHQGWNWAQSFLVGSSNSGHPPVGSLLVAHPQGPPLISGGTVGVEGSVAAWVGMGLIVWAVHRSWPAEGFQPLQPAHGVAEAAGSEPTGPTA